MPEALISRMTSRGPGVGSGNSLSSSFRSPRNTTPCMASSSDSGWGQRLDTTKPHVECVVYGGSHVGSLRVAARDRRCGSPPRKLAADPLVAAELVLDRVDQRLPGR